MTKLAAQDKNKEVAPFLKNLRKMLDHESDEVLRWTPNGRAFEIHDMEHMMEYVLPKYFKHRKYTSFQRQLNYFNFKKWTKSKAAVCTFSNDFFLRDQPDLSWRITRKKSMSATSPTASKTGSARKNSTAPSDASITKQVMRPYESNWNVQDMAIVVPRTKVEPQNDSYPSPTDVDMMLLDSETEVQRYYNQFAMYPHGEESLDWIDTFLPSLEVHPKVEDQYYYHSSMNVPSILRTSHYAPANYHSLPAPSNFGCVSTAL